MTQDEIWEFHKKQREEEKAREAAHNAKREKITKMFRELGSYPITQHPDYQQDIAFDIDDIVELFEEIAL